jgi:hypothetical protein
MENTITERSNEQKKIDNIMKKVHTISCLVTVSVRNDTKTKYDQISINSHQSFSITMNDLGEMMISIFSNSLKGTVLYKVGHNDGEVYAVKMKVKYFDANDNYLGQQDTHLLSPAQIAEMYNKLKEASKPKMTIKASEPEVQP